MDAPNARACAARTGPTFALSANGIRMILSHPITFELAQICRRPVPPAVRMRAALHLLDWLGCAVYGLRYLHGKALLNYLRDVPDGKASALGAGKKHFEQAAFHNACLGNIAEMDDVHRSSILHPGPVVIPTALAVAEHTGASGARLLEAIVRGYEVMIRIGQFLGPKHYAFFHNTSTAGSFGAAAAAADLLELNDEQFTWALGNAGTRTGGFWQMRHEPCMSKSLHSGLAAQNGLLAALLAKRNFTGPKLVLEGPQGLFPAIAQDGNPVEIIFEPDAPHRMLDVSFKPWPACRHAHAAIDAALLVKAKLPVNAQIEAVMVESYADAMRFCDKPEPRVEIEAKFSLQHAVAVALTKTRPMLEDFSPPFTNPKANAMRGKIKLVENPEITARYPKQYGARVTVVLSNGEPFVAEVQDAWGDPANPLTLQDIDTKFGALLVKVGVDGKMITMLSQAVKQIPEAKNLMEFSRLLVRVQAG
jgi:2-methylcitrate dehydratase PrpD